MWAYGFRVVLCVFFMFFHAFWRKTESPKSPKWDPGALLGAQKRGVRPRAPHLRFAQFFWVVFGAKNGPKTEAKSVPESSSKIVPSQVALGDAFLQAQGGAGA